MGIFIPEYVESDDGETFKLQFEGQSAPIELSRQQVKKLIDELNITLHVTEKRHIIYDDEN